MKEETRTRKSVRNVIIGLISKIILIILPFINRTIIILYLGKEYLGLGSLYTSILSVLNLSELGFSFAIVYSMYGLIANNNIEGICSLLNYYRKIYRTVGIIIFGCGLAIMPFLSKFISGEYPGNINIYLLFFIYLVQTVSSYLLLGYKSVILSAHQRMDIINGVQTSAMVVQHLFQLIILMITRNYYLYALMCPTFTIVYNFAISYIARKRYSGIFCKGSISGETKRKIKKQVSGLVADRISVAVRNSCDNIVISSIFGLSVLAQYSNYYYIMYSGVYGTLLFLTQAIQAGVGDSIARDSVEKNYKDFLIFNFLFGWINTIAITCMFGLFQPFIELWVGKDNMFNNYIMILFCIYGYFFNICTPINPYFDGNGLWENVKELIIFSAVLNVILNVLLGKLIGISGIIIATIVSLTIPYIFGRIRCLYKNYFQNYKMLDYYKGQLLYLVVTVTSCLCVFVVEESKPFTTITGVVGIIMRFIFCLIISNIIMFAVYFRTRYFRWAKEFIVSHFIKRKNI